MKQTKTMETKHELQELEELREGMELLKERMEQERIVQDSVLYALIAKEMHDLDQEHITNTVFLPLLIYPMMIAMIMFESDAPMLPKILFGVALYAITFWLVWRKNKKVPKDNAFGRIGRTAADVEAYCQKKLKGFWLDVLKLLATFALLWAVYAYFGLWDWDTALVSLGVCAVVASVMHWRRIGRYKRILRGIEAVRSELGD